MDSERWGYIHAMMSVAEDFSDGAWNGFIFGECGIDPEEVVEYERRRSRPTEPTDAPAPEENDG